MERPTDTAPSRCSPGGCRTDVGTASWPVPAGCSTRWPTSPSATPNWPRLEPGPGRRARWTTWRDYRFDGDIDGYPEGELYFPGSPLLSVRGTFGNAVILETLVLSILNYDCAVASAAARMVGGRRGPAR